MTLPPTPAPEAARLRIFGHARVLVLLVLLGLLALCIVLSWTTRGAMANLAARQAQGGAAGKSLVDLSPWQTAQTLAALAVTSEESDYAHQAEHLADHEVDQAFAAALRAAQLKTRRQILTGDALTLSQRLAQLQQEVAQDRTLAAQVKAKSSTAGSDDASQIAEAQLGLDSDELADAQHDLDRATGNASVALQDELNAHQASMHEYDTHEKYGGEIATVSIKHRGTLIGRIASWFNQRDRYASLEQARSDAESDLRSLTAEHNTLEAKMQADASAAKAPLTLAQIQDRSTERQILSIDDDRIQTDLQLADTYDKWGKQVQLQHRLILHLILQSFQLIVIIIACMIVGDALVRRLMAHPSLDRRQTETLRTVLDVGVQVLGVLLIALILFGPPQQTATMIGLATAALTIALQDYILAFLGWFMLVGKNGIHVGDLVEINGISGEVVEVGLVTTTLLETSGLAERGEPTGRRVSFLNSFAIRGQYFNFSSKGQWLWDEITFGIPSGDDVDAFAQAVQAAAHEETDESARLAEQEWGRSARTAGLSRPSAAPVVTMRPSGGAIDIQVRYVTRAAGRVEVRDRLYRRVLRLFQEKNRAPSPATAAS
ncbi:MAG TPA: mechanosensitive ion channel domain-containing protein [Acidobacteriaceae bacterium]|jgi:small-conductance mechanosensitive channel